ncbi:MAG TPA: ribosomal protein S18-alanine N-acetyltransferase [Candidatus Binataceae bacterium]|jgi:ribosomal-protein-alanine N-acetyltransferase|nr:ribosomal protein S18-alanine N-acetyltransferase [Candidatus Binataceae bacterium]
MKIRDASRRDLPGIMEIERLAFDQPWSLESFARELSLPFSRMIVAANIINGEERLVGFLCRWLVTDECHILNIAVHPEMRRRGIADQLMKNALAEAKVREALVITLEVRRSNLAARSLYRRFDFEERRLRKNYYGPGEDAIIMELKLG